ncbi:MAG: Ku protein [Acidimicrobiia bacterium]|nr:Ku protein [Acidimicrobiia bacterium]NNC75100.1 Ku protein [Acidimicrobiia bacterium]
MRPIWKGAITFGLVTIPVGLFAATEDKRPKFKQLRESDHSAIKYKRVAETDGTEVQYENIVKGYEFEKGRFVVFSSGELGDIMKGVAGGTVDVKQFVPASDIDPIYYRTSYYLAPEKTGLKAYKILLAALEEGAMVGLAKAAIREREYLVTLRADEGVLVMETMYWPDEIREPAFETLQEEVEVTGDEVKMAQMLIDNLTTGFDPSEWNDESREAIEAAAQAKVDGQEIVAPEAPQPTGVVDLMEALKASVEATKAQKAG